jgi:hypothetical protein
MRTKERLYCEENERGRKGTGNHETGAGQMKT